MTAEGLTIAMPKGRIFEEAVQLMRKTGYSIPSDFAADSRRLTVTLPDEGIKFFLAKPMDVATYVEYGVADLGVVGKDVLLEEKRDVYELLDLQISPCHLAVAGLPDWRPGPHPRVATKYPTIAENYFKSQGEQVEIIKLNGSIELAPLVGLAERIVDIVSTGKTLQENGLVELNHIVSITSRLIGNRASYRLKNQQVQTMCDRLASVVQGGTR